jgi:hypothetical protein
MLMINTQNMSRARVLRSFSCSHFILFLSHSLYASKLTLYTKALQSNFGFGKALSSRVTSTTRKTQKQQLKLLNNEFGRYITSLVVI